MERSRMTLAGAPRPSTPVTAESALAQAPDCFAAWSDSMPDMSFVVEVSDGTPGHLTLVIREQEGFGVRCACGYATFHHSIAISAMDDADAHRQREAERMGIA